VEFARPVVVAGEERDAAQAGETVRGLQPQPQPLGEFQAFPVQSGRFGIVPGCLGPVGEREGRLQLAPPVAQLAEEGDGTFAVLVYRRQIAAGQCLARPQAQRGGDAPSVAEPLELRQHLVDQGRAAGHIAGVEQGEPEEGHGPRPCRQLLPGRPTAQRGGDQRCVFAAALQQRQPGVPAGGGGPWRRRRGPGDSERGLD